MVRNKDTDIPDESCEMNGATWQPVTLNVRLSGKSNYILTKMGLFHPNVTKTKLIKDILEKTLVEIDRKLSKV